MNQGHCGQQHVHFAGRCQALKVYHTLECCFPHPTLSFKLSFSIHTSDNMTDQHHTSMEVNLGDFHPSDLTHTQCLSLRPLPTHWNQVLGWFLLESKRGIAPKWFANLIALPSPGRPWKACGCFPTDNEQFPEKQWRYFHQEQCTEFPEEQRFPDIQISGTGGQDKVSAAPSPPLARFHRVLPIDPSQLFSASSAGLRGKGDNQLRVNLSD